MTHCQGYERHPANTPIPSHSAPPPFCPNPSCTFHLPRDRTWHWVRDGWSTRPSDQRRFQRFRCRHCGRRFSTRTFSATYWLKKRRLLAQVAQTLSNGTALRQAARIRKVSHSTIALHQSRLSRHCLLYQTRELAKVEINEPVVVDGFETFEYSQYFPFHVNLAVGQDSWYVYAFTDSPLRRKGKMTPRQKADPEGTGGPTWSAGSQGGGNRNGGPSRDSGRSESGDAPTPQ
ncbi:MAG: hypothetical protein R3E97_16260 [Candidatus Eisenbacteria bacterium]